MCMVFCVFYFHQVFRFFHSKNSFLYYFSYFPIFIRIPAIPFFLFLRVYVSLYICVSSFSYRLSSVWGLGRRLLRWFGSAEALTFITPANAKCRSYSRSATPCILHLHRLALSVHQWSFRRQKCGGL